MKNRRFVTGCMSLLLAMVALPVMAGPLVPDAAVVSSTRQSVRGPVSMGEPSDVSSHASHDRELDPDARLSSLRAKLGGLSGLDELIAVYAEMAGIEELLGRYVEAKAHYRSIIDLAKDADTSGFRLRFIALCLELGLDTEARTMVDELLAATTNPPIRSRALVFDALLREKAGEHAAAVSVFESIADGLDSAGALLYSYYSLCTLREPDAAAAARKKHILSFSKRYARSPEYSYVAHLVDPSLESRIEIFPSPYALAGSHGKMKSTGPAETNNEATPRPQNPVKPMARKSIGIQTGSYRVRENAEYQQDALKKKGFEADIVEKKGGGDVTLFTVIVPIDDERASATELLARLRKLGFDGYLVNR